MTTSQRLSLRLSEIRQRLNELAGAEAQLTEEQRAETDRLTREYQDVETRARAALVAESEEAEQRAADDGDGDGEARERRELRGKVSIGRYMAAAAQGVDLDGAEKEFNEAEQLATGAPTQMPVDLLAEPVEVRADAVTNIAAPNAGIARPLRRLFPSSVASYLGVQMPSVPVGQRSWPVMTAGTSAGAVAEGGARGDAGAATVSFKALNPVRVSGAYIFSIEDAATFAGLEELLRADIARVLSDQIDNLIVNGDGSAPNPSGLIKALGAANPDASAKVAAANVLDIPADVVDGVIADMPTNVRMVIGKDTLKVLAQTYVEDSTLLDVLRRFGAQVRVYKHMPAVASKKQSVLAYGGDEGAAVCPLWPSVSLIRDPLSLAGSGQVTLTAIALFNFALLRNDGYRHGAYQVKA